MDYKNKIDQDSYLLEKGRYFHSLLLDDKDGNKAYIFGGREMQDTMTQRCEKINFRQKKIENIDSMREPVLGFGCCQAYNNVLLTAGKDKL